MYMADMESTVTRGGSSFNGIMRRIIYPRIPTPDSTAMVGNVQVAMGVWNWPLYSTSGQSANTISVTSEIYSQLSRKPANMVAISVNALMDR